MVVPNGAALPFRVVDGVKVIHLVAEEIDHAFEWTLRQHGTFMFHSHHDEMTQMGMGLIGMFVVHPRSPSADDRVDRDFSLMISECGWRATTMTPGGISTRRGP